MPGKWGAIRQLHLSPRSELDKNCFSRITKDKVSTVSGERCKPSTLDMVSPTEISQ